MAELTGHPTELFHIRKKAGLTQSLVAGQLGVSKATYSAWETGRAELGADRIVALSKLFGCTPNDILGCTESLKDYSPLTSEEEECVLLFRHLPPNIREDILDIMRTTAKGWRLR